MEDSRWLSSKLLCAQTIRSMDENSRLDTSNRRSNSRSKKGPWRPQPRKAKNISSKKDLKMYNNDYKSGLKQLVESGAIPPFVYCYPPRSAYRPLPSEWTIDRIWEEDEANSPNNLLNVYLHVPFCRYKCGFCNLYTVISKSQTMYDRYTAAICRQMKMHARIIQRRNLRTFYIGGGTPSLLSKENFRDIFETLQEIYPNWRTVVQEVAIEATPDSIVGDPEIVPYLMSLGLTRMNIGIQSLQKEELREAGRAVANEKMIRAAIEIIRSNDLPNLSTDLIIGFQGQTDESWQVSVQELAKLRPDTISTYFLTIRPDAWFHKTGQYQYMRDPSLYKRYEYAREIFLKAGYVQESNVRYKLPSRGGYQQKVLQFRGVPYLGIGAGARTYTNTIDYLIGGTQSGGRHDPHISEIEEYIENVESDTLEIKSGFTYTEEERIRKRLVLDNFDLNLRDLDKYNFSKHRHKFQSILNEAVQLKLMVRLDQDKYQLTKLGFKYRDIFSWHMYSDRVIDLDREFYRGIHELKLVTLERKKARSAAKSAELVSSPG